MERIVNRPKGSSPTVGIVVLNWNNYAETSECLSSLTGINYGNVTIYLVDNGSKDGSGQKLKEEFNSYEFVPLKENRGFAGGMNEGIRHALNDGMEYVWLLNNDLIISDPNVLRNLIDFMGESEDVGICSPRVNYHSESSRVWFEQGRVNWETCMTLHTTTDHNSSIAKNDYVPFCSALISKGVFDDVGLLPEQYFLYYEDTHFCIKAREAGYKIVTLLDESVSHRRSNSNASPTMLYYTTRNRLLFAEELDRIYSLHFILSYLYWVIHRLAGRVLANERVRLVAILRGVIDGIQRHDGRGPYP